MLYHSAYFSVKENNIFPGQGRERHVASRASQRSAQGCSCWLAAGCITLAHLSQELRTYRGTLKTIIHTTGEYFGGNEARPSVHLLFEDRKEATLFFPRQVVFAALHSDQSWHQTNGPVRIIVRLVCSSVLQPAVGEKRTAGASIAGTTFQIWTQGTQGHGSQGSFGT